MLLPFPGKIVSADVPVPHHLVQNKEPLLFQVSTERQSGEPGLPSHWWYPHLPARVGSVDRDLLRMKVESSLKDMVSVEL